MIPRRRPGSGADVAAPPPPAGESPYSPTQKAKQGVVGASSPRGSPPQSHNPSSQHHHNQHNRGTSTTRLVLIAVAVGAGYLLPTVLLGTSSVAGPLRKQQELFRDPALSLPYQYIGPPALIPTKFYGVEARAFPRKGRSATKCRKKVRVKRQPTLTDPSNGAGGFGNAAAAAVDDDQREDEDLDEVDSDDGEDNPLNGEYHDQLSAVGFLYQRVVKAASTTSASVNVRLAIGAANPGGGGGGPFRTAGGNRRRRETEICQHRVGFGFDEDRPMAQRFGGRDVSKSFLWTTLRHPNSRYTSHFFHSQVARRTQNPTDQNFKAWLEVLPNDYYLSALAVDGFDDAVDTRHLAVVDALVGSGAGAAAQTAALENTLQKKMKQAERQKRRFQRFQARKLEKEIVPDDPIEAYPRKLHPSWLRNNPNKGNLNFPRDQLKAGKVAYVFKEGSRKDFGAELERMRKNQNRRRLTGFEHETVDGDLTDAHSRRLEASRPHSSPNGGRIDLPRPEMKKGGAVSALASEEGPSEGNVDPEAKQQHRRLAGGDNSEDAEKGGARVQAANSIIRDYDFIAIAERFEESMVALMMILNRPMADILHLPMKVSPGFDEGMNGQCYFMWKPFVTGGMEAYLDSPQWRQRTKYEVALYEAANRSLDMTIQKLGVKEFEINMGRFLYAQRVVKERCWGRITTPCDMGGRLMGKTDCWHKDTGCGNSCLDRVATELGLW